MTATIRLSGYPKEYRLTTQKPTVKRVSSYGKCMQTAFCPECGRVLMDFIEGEHMMLYCDPCGLAWVTGEDSTSKANHKGLVDAILSPEEAIYEKAS